MKQITAALIGAGSRGQYVYAPYSLKYPYEIKFTAVAELLEEKRTGFAKNYGISPENVFSSWEEMLAGPKLADCVIISTMDNAHTEPAFAAIEKGYKYILMEKPIDTDTDKCLKLAAAANENGVNIQVCHTLRYTSFYRRLKKILDSKRLGDIVNIVHTEGVGFFHQAHSFVRGNWAKAENSSPMILAKCCHDMDLFLYLTNKNCVSLSSFGSLTYFKPENAPKSSSDRCIHCSLRDGCPYDAVKIYSEGGLWPIPNTPHIEGFESLQEMLDKGRLGRCVFRCENDVVDHQITNMVFEDSLTVSFTMSAFSRKIGRETRIMCTNGEIYADFEKSVIDISDFTTGNTEVINVSYGTSGHNGADDLMMKEFIETVRGEKQGVTDINMSVQSHVMCMLAEKSRLSGGAVQSVNDMIIKELRK